MARVGDWVTYDANGVFLADLGISARNLTDLAPRLEDARRAIIGEPSSAEALLELPEQMLDDYVERRDASVLGCILATARRLRDRVDRIVVLGNRAVETGVRALLDACCEPHFNELTRGQRGGRPRVYFAGSHLDNDAIAGLLTVLTEGRSPNRLEDRWAILLLASARDRRENNVVFQCFLSALRAFYRDDASALAEMIVTESIDDDFSLFSPAGLLPAALVGADVVRMLEGASAMNDIFRSAPVGNNSVLDFVGIGHLWGSEHQPRIRGLRIWSTALESAAKWYMLLVNQALAGNRSVVTVGEAAGNLGGTRCQVDCCQPAACCPILWTNVIVQQCRCDPLPANQLDTLLGDSIPWTDSSLPDMLASAIHDSSVNDRQNGCPAAELRLSRLNEHTVGQLLQMWMLAAVVERNLGSSDFGAGQGYPG